MIGLDKCQLRDWIGEVLAPGREYSVDGGLDTLKEGASQRMKWLRAEVGGRGMGRERGHQSCQIFGWDL